MVTREARQSAADPYAFVMSTDEVDRMGDVVEIPGIDLAQFKQNPIALWQHDPASPIGVWEGLKKSAGQLVGKLKLADPGTSPLIDRLRQLIEQRILRAVSIGFRALAAEPTGDGFGLRFTSSELVEASLVSIPANASALRIRSLAPHPADAQIFSGTAGATGSSTRTRADPPSPRRTLANPQRGSPMAKTISERIVAHQTRSASIDAELNAIQEAVANDDDREFTPEEMATVETLTSEKSAVVKNIETLQQLESTLAARAEPIGNGTGGGHAGTGTSGRSHRVEPRFAVKERPGAILGKLAAVAGLSRALGRSPAEIIATRYAADDRVGAAFDYVSRAAVNIADSTTPTWAVELVRQDVAAFMDDLVNVSVFASLRARGSSISLTLDGAGSITLPSRTRGGANAMAGAWVGEGGAIPVLQGSFGAKKLEPTKLAGITTFTKELMTATNDTVEQVLTDGLRHDTADKLDVNLLDAIAKVNGVRPAGLRVGASSAASGGATAVAADIKAAIAPILAAGGGTDIVMVMNPREVLGLSLAKNMLGVLAYPEVQSGSFQGYPFIVSNNVTAGVVYVLDCGEFANAAGVPEIDSSQEATLTMANADSAVPTQALDAAHAVGTIGQVLPDGGIPVVGPGGTGTIGYQAMSMFQQYAIAVRLVLPVSWLMRRDNMVSVITGVAWG